MPKQQSTLTDKQIKSLVLLRVVFGLLFLWAGLNKLLSGFTASSYLTNSTTGPFAELFQSMANNALVDFLVIFGEMAIGLSLILGALVWLSAPAGVLMMFLYYLSVFPPKTGYINEHIIYMLVFVALAVFKSGNYYGLENIIDRILKISGTAAKENRPV
jgi:thiosulfate dehydrogenase [quinone] large subunit